MYNAPIAFDSDGVADLGKRFDALIAQPRHSVDGAGAAAAVRAIEGRVVAQVEPAEALAALDHFMGRLVVVLDLVELGEDEAYALADAVAALCHEREWPLLLAIALPQIDALSSAVAVHASDTQLLCEALPTDWIAALAVTAGMAATGGSGMLKEEVRESEAARLARLNDEVARIADVLARLSRREDRGAGSAAEPRPAFADAPTPVAITATEVREVIRARRLRERFFPARLFEDPAWDIILDLFAAQLERAQVSVSSLCIAAAVAPTTALRWIAKLTEVGLLVREPDPFDKRRVFIALSARAKEGMARYLAVLGEAGLRLV